MYKEIDDTYKEKKMDEPNVIASDGFCISYSNARVLWENGEFSDWVKEHGGFPLEIDGETFNTWANIEDALSNDNWDDN